MLKPRTPEIVVKISKYCNLRCSYCYEFPDLGNKERMALDSIVKMFSNIFSEVDKGQMERLRFVWHGGEPFLIPIDYYEAIAGLQREVFADKIKVVNVVQTNLTILTDRHIEFLRSGFFPRSEFRLTCMAISGSMLEDGQAQKSYLPTCRN